MWGQGRGSPSFTESSVRRRPRSAFSRKANLKSEIMSKHSRERRVCVNTHTHEAKRVGDALCPRPRASEKYL